MVSRDLDNLIHRLSEIKDLGWIENKRYGNQGGVGNTLELFSPLIELESCLRIS